MSLPVAPILLIVFNRPGPTQAVFDAIRQARPAQLFVAADGPRAYKPGEAELCRQTRAIVEQVDWPCAVQLLFRNENVGCKLAVSEAISWFFRNVEAGIILEDDCLPDPTFFGFCTELLDRYADHEQVMHIGGINFQSHQTRTRAESYYVSGFTYNWGWATWKRAWQHFRIDPAEYVRQMPMTQPYFNPRIRLSIDETIKGYLDSWDVQWLVTVRRFDGLALNPTVNLVRNIGFGFDATHTVRQPAWMDQLVFGQIKTLVHPANLTIDRALDEADEATVYRQPWYMAALERVIWPVRFYLNQARIRLARRPGNQSASSVS
jgi:hypothetical protein